MKTCKEKKKENQLKPQITQIDVAEPTKNSKTNKCLRSTFWKVKLINSRPSLFKRTKNLTKTWVYIIYINNYISLA